MKKISDIAAPMMAGQLPVESSRPQALDQASARFVNALFRELKSCFPAWRQAWPEAADENAAKATWVKAFADVGITQIEQIRYGIKRCRQLKTDFMPSVGRFIDMCRPDAEALGLPSEALAFAEAVRNAHPACTVAWSHEVVKLAAHQVGLFDLAGMDADKARRAFGKAYGSLIERLGKGEPLTSAPLALEHDGARPVAELAADFGESRARSVREAQGIPERMSRDEALAAIRGGLSHG